MGLSHAASGGIIFMAAMFAGFQMGDASFDGQDTLSSDWSEFHEEERTRAATSFSIDGVQRFGASRTEVTVTNTGSTTLHAERVILLFDGVPVDTTSREVEGVASTVWAPETTLLLTTAAVAPSAVVVADENGVKAFWRA